jgi:hypothetical protein
LFEGQAEGCSDESQPENRDLMPSHGLKVYGCLPKQAL